MKLQRKQREGSKVHRTYDQAQTPMQRLLASGTLSPKKQQELQRITEALDPLRRLPTARTLTEGAVAACPHVLTKQPCACFATPVFGQRGSRGTCSCRWHSWDSSIAAQTAAETKISKKWTASCLAHTQGSLRRRVGAGHVLVACQSSTYGSRHLPQVGTALTWALSTNTGPHLTEGSGQAVRTPPGHLR